MKPCKRVLCSMQSRGDFIVRVWKRPLLSAPLFFIWQVETVSMSADGHSKPECVWIFFGESPAIGFATRHLADLVEEVLDKITK